jgi:hypothetical protein
MLGWEQKKKKIQRLTKTYVFFRHDLTSEERIAYTDAVLCLQSKEAKTPSDLAEGAKSRFDDFIVTVCTYGQRILFPIRPDACEARTISSPPLFPKKKL